MQLCFRFAGICSQEQRTEPCVFAFKVWARRTSWWGERQQPSWQDFIVGCHSATDWCGSADTVQQTGKTVALWFQDLQKGEDRKQMCAFLQVFAGFCSLSQHLRIKKMFKYDLGNNAIRLTIWYVIWPINIGNAQTHRGAWPGYLTRSPLAWARLLC